MAGQVMELLVNVASKLEGVERSLGDIHQDQKDLEREFKEILQRVATLENDGKWSGDERRKVDERLGSGDHTFQKLQHDVKEAGRIAAAALKLAQQKQVVKEPETKTIRKKLTENLIDHGVKALIWLALLALYHILLAGPRIAEAIKPHGGHP